MTNTVTLNQLKLTKNQLKITQNQLKSTQNNFKSTHLKTSQNLKKLIKQHMYEVDNKKQTQDLGKRK